MRDDLVYLMHTLHDVRRFTEGESYESFLEKRMVQNAVMRSFEVLGETHPGVPWRLSGDFRNKQTATEDAPGLLTRIAGLVENVTIRLDGQRSCTASTLYERKPCLFGRPASR